MKPKGATAVLQKTYDECYLTCSTAIYFESKGNEDEALRSWRNALRLIQSYENTSARRGSLSSNAISQTEKALIDSLGSLKLQCLERIDILDALRISRLEEEEHRKILRQYNGGEQSPPVLPPRPSIQSSASSTTATIGYGDRDQQAPPSYFFLHDDYPAADAQHLRPPHDRRPSGSSIATGSSYLLGPGLPPNALANSNSSTRTPSPEKKSFLTTLRGSGAGANAKFSQKRPNSRPAGADSVAAAARAATRAWSSNGRNDGLSVGRSFQDSSSATLATMVSRSSAGGRSSLDIRPESPTSPTNSLPQVPQIPPALPSASPRYTMAGAKSAPPPSTNFQPFPAPSDPEQPYEDFPDPFAYMVPPHDSHSGASPPSYSTADSTNSAVPDIGNLSVASPGGSRRTTSEPPNTEPRHQLPPIPPPMPPPKPPKKASLQAPKTSTRRPSQEFQWPHNPMTAKLEVPAPRPSSSEDDTNRSSKTSYLSKPSDKSKDKRVPSSSKIPLYELADTSQTGEIRTGNDNDDAWNKRVAAALKSLDKGVDQTAAKQIINEIVIHGDEVHWEDIAGLDAAKLALKEAVVYPFLRPDLFSGLREPARGMLLFGPPGTGKTMLARAVATESRSTFFSISASSLTSKFLGESEKLVRALFQLAKALAPAIIFIDEIDSLLSTRSGSGEHEATRRIKTEFLIQWSDLQRAAAGKEARKGEGDASRVLVLAATNLPWAIDEAARRRFVRRQYIPLPEGPVRVKQLKNLLKLQKHTLTERDLNQLEILTEDFSGSDITALAKDAAMGPLRSLGEALLHMSMDEIRPIMLDDFKASLKSIRPSVSKEGLKEYEEWANNFGERV